MHNAIDRILKRGYTTNKKLRSAIKFNMKGDSIMVNTCRLKGRIRELNLTQENCAKTLGIKCPTFNQKINNIRSFSLNQAEELAKLLKIDDDDFGEFFFSS